MMSNFIIGLSHSVLTKSETKRRDVEANFERCFLQNAFGVLERDIAETERKKGKKLKPLYLDDKMGTNVSDPSVFSGLTDMYTDSFFAAGTDLAVDALVNRKDGAAVFYYRFDHVTSLSLADFFGSTAWELVKNLFARFALGQKPTKVKSHKE